MRSGSTCHVIYSNGYQTVDRLNTDHGGENESPTYEQELLSSGTTPYTRGF